MSAERPSAGDALPPGCTLIEIHVGELRQLFNTMDPTPFPTKDLAPSAEEFIVGWAREAPRYAPLALLVYIDRPAGLAEEPVMLRQAIQDYFGYRSQMSRRQLRQLFRVGRISLLIGLGFLTASIAVGDLIARLWRVGGVVREGLLIGGWVAMWRPIEIFLYDWWPIRSEARLYDRLGAMPVRIAYTADARSEAWRSDWPAAAPTPTSAPRQALAPE